MSLWGWNLKFGWLVRRALIAALPGWDTACGSDWDKSFSAAQWDTAFGA